MNNGYKKYLIFSDATIVEAMEKINHNAKGILFITDDKYKLLGSVTDGDIRRWLIKTGNLYGKIQDVMNRAPHYLGHNEVSKAIEYMKLYEITALPIVNANCNIIDIVFLNDDNIYNVNNKNMLENVQTIIMAGGKGTRLYPYTKILPKPLIPIGDIPIMERIIRKFLEFGVEKFYITVNYRKKMIQSYFSESSEEYNLAYIEEEKPLGTAGSLSLFQGELSKPIFVTNCDILIDTDYGEIYKYHQTSGNEITIVAALKNITVPYGVIKAGENGQVDSLEEKPRLSYLVNTGMYILNPDILKEIPKDTFYHMTDLTSKLLKEGRKVGMYPISEESFLDMGEFEEMNRMEAKLNLKME